MTRGEELFLCLLLGVSVGFVIGLVAGSKIAIVECNRDAIRHNAAHYDDETGKFTWNDPERKDQP